MNNGVIATVDHTPRNAGLFASVLRTYAFDSVEVVTLDGRKALEPIREFGHTGLPLLFRSAHFLRGWGR